MRGVHLVQKPVYPAKTVPGPSATPRRAAAFLLQRTATHRTGAEIVASPNDSNHHFLCILRAPWVVEHLGILRVSEK